MLSKLIAQGAEARIILSGDFIIKDRISKQYRIQEIDKKIREQRTHAETKLLAKASKIINCPIPVFSERKTKMKIPFIKGEKISEHLNNFPFIKQKKILNQIGKNLAKLHEENIIHGDLTTANMILKEDKIYFIDFGLGYFNGRYEDKAVDIHLLKQALEAKHFQNWKKLYEEFEKGYTSINKSESKKVLNQLIKVEKRGRYKFKDFEPSKTKIKKGIESGKYSGGDDKKLATVAALKKRYPPKVFLKFTEQAGLLEVDKIIDKK
jgi:TP53 regulating kinase and related kinases